MFPTLVPGYDNRIVCAFLPAAFHDDPTSDACRHVALEVVTIGNRIHPKTRDRVWACENCGEVRDFVALDGAGGNA
jgi:hypothetical protein